MIITKTIKALARKNIRCLKPCVHGGKVWEAIQKTEKSTLLDFSSSINPFGASQKAVEAISSSLKEIPFYPDSNSTLLREAIAERFESVSAANIVVGNGSTELIYLFAETFLEKNDTALMSAPTFGEYESAVLKADGKPVHVRLGGGLCFDAEGFVRRMKGVKVVFLCSPNNPTGMLISYEALVSVVEAALGEGVLVCLDENFLEFVDADKQVSLIGCVKSFPNLFVLRSFTKVFGLTGLRVGYGVGSEEMIKVLSNAKMPWSVNCLGQVGALAALEDKEHLEKCQNLMKTERGFLANKLKQVRGFEPYPADANYFLVNIKGSGFTASQLSE
ncbi:MAG: histidinol-phosphate aminotransferase family protein, partial [Candidatus Bathyarchaeota archaeon]|nr:histidinol-phosphate aminotransferase family protein [Candidatus Bathyarchaeota archaeon]